MESHEVLPMVSSVVDVLVIHSDDRTGSFQETLVNPS